MSYDECVNHPVTPCTTGEERGCVTRHSHVTKREVPFLHSCVRSRGSLWVGIGNRVGMDARWFSFQSELTQRKLKSGGEGPAAAVDKILPLSDLCSPCWGSFMYRVPEIRVCAWLVDISSCSCLTVCLLKKIYQPFFLSFLCDFWAHGIMQLTVYLAPNLGRAQSTIDSIRKLDACWSVTRWPWSLPPLPLFCLPLPPFSLFLCMLHGFSFPAWCPSSAEADSLSGSLPHCHWTFNAEQGGHSDAFSPYWANKSISLIVRGTSWEVENWEVVLHNNHVP